MTERTSPSTLRLAELRHSDLARCADLEKVLFPGEDPWSEAAFASELRRGHYYVGAFNESGLLIGYAGLAVAGHAQPEAEVHNVGVDPAHQRKGVGRALLRALLAHADKLGAPTFLEVRTDNDSAISLYQAHGFEVMGLRKKYYQPSGADAYTMRRPVRSTVEEGGGARA